MHAVCRYVFIYGRNKNHKVADSVYKRMYQKFTSAVQSDVIIILGQKCSLPSPVLTNAGDIYVTILSYTILFDNDSYTTHVFLINSSAVG